MDEIVSSTWNNTKIKNYVFPRAKQEIIKKNVEYDR